MTTQNKNTVIEALIKRFSPLDGAFPSSDAILIRASCENIYQSGYLQGKYDALEESLKAFKEESP